MNVGSVPFQPGVIYERKDKQRHCRLLRVGCESGLQDAALRAHSVQRTGVHS